MTTFNASEYVIQNLQEYGSYFNEERAIPSIYSGLKPVQTKILFAAKGLGLKSTGKYKKVVNLVGATMPLYQHGDSSLHGAIARMGQDWKSTYPLLSIQGNIGSQSSLTAPNSGAAHPRYIETRLSVLGELLLDSIKDGTAKMIPNFDGTIMEPENLFAPIPMFLLLNQKGIGVGTATSIPSFKLSSVVAVTEKLMQNPDLSFQEIANTLQPFYIQGAKVINKSELAEIYSHQPRDNKKGSIKFRAEFKTQDNKMIITNFPYDASPSKVINQITSKTTEVESFRFIKKAQDTTSINSQNATIVSMELLLGNTVDAEELIRDLCYHTSLESYANINLVMLDKHNKVKEYNVKTALLDWIEIFREKTVDKLNSEKNGLLTKVEVLNGLIRAIGEDIDEIIQLIKSSDSRSAAKAKIMGKNYTDLQADAILDMKLVKLANLEYAKLLNEKEQYVTRIAEIESILTSPENLKTLMTNTMQSYVSLDTYTPISMVDALTPKVKKLKSENVYLVLGKNSISVEQEKPKKYDFIASKTNPIMVLADNMVHPISNAKEEYISAVHAVVKQEKGYVIHISKDGYVKKTEIHELETARKAKATSQDVFTAFVQKAKIIKVLTKAGLEMEVDLDNIKVTKRGAKGTKITKFGSGDSVVGVK